MQLMQTAKYKEIEPTANTKIAVAMALLLANALACVLYLVTIKISLLTLATLSCMPFSVVCEPLYYLRLIPCMAELSFNLVNTSRVHGH